MDFTKDKEFYEAGEEMARGYQHDGIKILKTAFAALEDANYHDEAKKVLKMIGDIETAK